MFRKTVCISIVLIFCLFACAYAARLVWDANTETDLAGYKVYRGQSSGSYDHIVDVGNVTEHQIEGLDPGTYFYGVTAYNISGTESGFSDEINYVEGTQAIAAATDLQVGWSEVTSMAILFSDTFEDSDGVNLATRTGWAGDSSDTIEIDTGQFKGGASSLKCNGSDTKACYATFTKQTTGKHTYDFWIRWASLDGSITDFFILSEGVYVWETTSWWTIIGTNTNSLIYYPGSGDAINIATAALAINTWFHIEIEVDMDANTMNVWLDGVKVGTNIAASHNIDPDRYTISDNTDATDEWIDSLSIYEGARVAAGGLSIPVAMDHYRQRRN